MLQLVALAVLAISASAEKGPNWYPICDQVLLLGYPCENQTVLTADGFQLGIVRIPPKNSSAYPVILQHGLMDSAITYVANAQAYQNLACILHDAGYDVYITNSRGTHYSTNIHFPADTKNMTYWRSIDFDQMGNYDFPANIDHARRVSGHDTVTYIGHSQGTTQAFAALSYWRPEYSSKIDLFVALAPAVFGGGVSAVGVHLLADLHLAEVEEALGMYSPLTNGHQVRDVVDKCPELGSVCLDIFGAIFGWGNLSNIDIGQLPNIVRYDPGGTSMNNLIHWLQLIRRKTIFGTHDYDNATINTEIYGQATAPVYNLSSITAPKIMLCTGGKDALADPQDVELLIATLNASHVIVQHEYFDNYGHMDFVWGLDAHIRLYPKIVDAIKKYAKN